MLWPSRLGRATGARAKCAVGFDSNALAFFFFAIMESKEITAPLLGLTKLMFRHLISVKRLSPS